MTDPTYSSPPPAPQPPAYPSAGPLPPSPMPPAVIPKDPTAAVLLEIIPGLAIQTFGIGNLYAGNVLVGVLLMVGYWASCVVNFLLCFVCIGAFTWPLTWLAFAIGASYLAWQKAQSTRPGNT